MYKATAAPTRSGQEQEAGWQAAEWESRNLDLDPSYSETTPRMYKPVPDAPA